MIPDDEPTVQPPDSSEVFDDDIEKEKTAKRRSPPSTHPTPFLHPMKPPRHLIQNKNKKQRPEIEIMTLKDP